jgi:hypothetical protein
MDNNIIIDCNEYVINYDYNKENLIILDKCPLIGLLNFLFIKYFY